jgi:hypothetical protein
MRTRAPDKENAQAVARSARSAADRDVVGPAIDRGVVAEDQRQFVQALAAYCNRLIGDV